MGSVLTNSLQVQADAYHATLILVVELVLMALLVLASLQVGGRKRKRLCQHPPEVEEAGEQTDTKNETRRIPDPYHMHHDPPIFPHGEMLGQWPP